MILIWSTAKVTRCQFAVWFVHCESRDTALAISICFIMKLMNGCLIWSTQIIIISLNNTHTITQLVISLPPPIGSVLLSLSLYRIVQYKNCCRLKILFLDISKSSSLTSLNPVLICYHLQCMRCCNGLYGEKQAECLWSISIKLVDRGTGGCVSIY